MSTTDLTFLHAPSVYDFRRRATLWGPISDVVPSTPIYDMYNNLNGYYIIPPVHALDPIMKAADSILSV